MTIDGDHAVTVGPLPMVVQDEGHFVIRRATANRSAPVRPPRAGAPPDGPTASWTGELGRRALLEAKAQGEDAATVD